MRDGVLCGHRQGLQRIAMARRQRHGAPQAETGVVLVGEADGTVELDVLARQGQRCRGCSPHAGGRRPAGASRAGTGRLMHERTRRGERDVAVDRSMLQRLEASDRHAELPAQAQVVEAHRQGHRHQAATVGRICEAKERQ